MIYLLKFRDNGVPKPGLTPVWTSLLKVSDGTDLSVDPNVDYPIEPVGAGTYKYEMDPTEEVTGVVDGGATLLNALERYVEADMSPSDNPVSIMGAGTYVPDNYVTNGGTFDLYISDDISKGFTINGDMTGYSLYFYMKDSKNDAAFVIEDRLLSGWSAASGLTTGLIDFLSDDTVNRTHGSYPCGIRAKKTSDGKSPTVWEATAKLRKGVSKKADLP